MYVLPEHYIELIPCLTRSSMSTVSFPLLHLDLPLPPLSLKLPYLSPHNLHRQPPAHFLQHLFPNACPAPLLRPRHANQHRSATLDAARLEPAVKILQTRPRHPTRIQQRHNAMFLAGHERRQRIVRHHRQREHAAHHAVVNHLDAQRQAVLADVAAQGADGGAPGGGARDVGRDEQSQGLLAERGAGVEAVGGGEGVHG